MRLIPLAVSILVLAPAAEVGAADSVLLASRRGGWVEALDLETLETVARLRTPAMTESVRSDPSGQRLFIAAPKSDQSGCCALFALDPRSPRLSFIIEPAQHATIAANRLFTQRGDTGIDVFDTDSLTRLPSVRAAGIYRLRASPDGRLLFGISTWRGPSLDLFDAARGERIASQALPEKASFAGAWVGTGYYLLTVRAGQAALSRVSPISGELGETVALHPPGGLPDCQPSLYDATAAGGRVAIYAEFGHKLDGACPVPGGFVLADPETGVVTGRLAAGLRFRQIVASADGRHLYGLDAGAPAWRRVQVVKMDAASGKILAVKQLAADVWYLTAGQIPSEVRGRLDLAAIPPSGVN
jgi:hypothetical protein